MSASTMRDALSRLHRKIRYPLVPCCYDGAALHLADAAPAPYFWGPKEDSPSEIASSRNWLQQYVAPAGVATLAVQTRTWLYARWEQEDITVDNSKTDFVFAPMSKVPAPATSNSASPPTAEQLLELLPFVLGMYETKTSKQLTGECPTTRALTLAYQ
jgi:hypothetical protein